MALTSSVFFIRPSQERKRPVIDFRSEANSRIAWDALREMLAGEREMVPALLAETTFVVDSRDAGAWDYYRIVGFSEFYSARAMQLLAPHASECVDFIRTRINALPYYCPRRKSELDCLDPERSRPHANRFFLRIRQIGDPCVFYVTGQAPMFLTQSVERNLRDAKLRGLETVETGRIRTSLTAAELAGVERVLGFTLPEAYKEFVVNYPSDLVTTEIDLNWKRESPADRELVIDPHEIINLNEMVRWPNTPWTEEDGPWPDHFFVIGDDQCGNYWAIDRRESNSCVVCFYDHDVGTFEPKHPSLDEFRRSLLQRIAGWNARNA